MSRTELYSVSPSHCLEIGHTSNSFRSAWYVWSQIAQKYLGLEGFPVFDKEAHKKVWNAHSTHPLTDAERVVLKTTMDYAVVYGRDAERLIDLYQQYAKDHPTSSIGEQAEIIKLRRLTRELKDDDMLAWNQTSVNCLLFECVSEEDTYEVISCDVSKAWDVFEEERRVNA